MLVKSQVKYIQSLSQKKLRDEEGVFIAEGPRIINELLNAGNMMPRQLFATAEWLSAYAEAAAGEPRKASQVKDLLVEVSPSELERISFLQTPNQVLGIFSKPVFPAGRDMRDTVSLMLDTIQDPGNLGTIIRCADWFGVGTVICSNSSADVFSPKVVQSTMGSIARVQVLYEDLPAFIRSHKELPVYAAALEGIGIDKLSPMRSGIILIGNESKGISEELLALSQKRITIPRRGAAESLNAAVATGIILSKVCG